MAGEACEINSTAFLVSSLGAPDDMVERRKGRNTTTSFNFLCVRRALFSLSMFELPNLAQYALCGWLVS